MAKVPSVTIVEEIPVRLRQHVRVQGALPKDWSPKPWRDLLRKLRDRWVALWQEKAKWSPQAHRRAQRQYNDDASLAMSLGKEPPPPPPTAEHFEQHRIAAAMALEKVEDEIDATMRTVVPAIPEHLRTYAAERTDIERAECELLGIDYNPSEIVFKLLYTANQIEAELKSGKGLRGNPDNFFKVYGIEL